MEKKENINSIQDFITLAQNAIRSGINLGKTQDEIANEICRDILTNHHIQEKQLQEFKNILQIIYDNLIKVKQSQGGKNKSSVSFDFTDEELKQNKNKPNIVVMNCIDYVDFTINLKHIQKSIYFFQYIRHNLNFEIFISLFPEHKYNYVIDNTKINTLWEKLLLYKNKISLYIDIEGFFETLNISEQQTLIDFYNLKMTNRDNNALNIDKINIQGD